jgi:hypothetical protein
VLRPLTIARRPERLRLACVRPGYLHRVSPRLGHGIACICCLIARMCHPVALVRGDLARGRGSQTGARLSISEMRRMLTMHAAHVTSPLIGPHHGFLVAGGLILV